MDRSTVWPHSPASPGETSSAGRSGRQPPAWKARAPSRWRPAGHMLFEQGDACTGLYQVLSGLVGLRKSQEDGATLLVGLAGEGDVIGYPDFLDRREHRVGAEMLEGGRLAFIAAAKVRALLAEDVGFLTALLVQASRDLSRIQEKLLCLHTRHADARLAEFFIAYSARQPKPGRGAASMFMLPLRHRDVADLLGLRPETLSRTVSALQAAGILTWKNHEVAIRDRASLARMAGH